MQTGNINTADHLFQSIVGMTNAEAVPIASGLSGGASSQDSSSPTPAPSPAPTPTAAASSGPISASGIPNLIGVAPGSAAVLDGLSPGKSVQTDAFGTGAGGIGTTIKMNTDGTYDINGPNTNMVGMSSAAIKALMGGNASASTLNAIKLSYTPMFGQSPSTASNYNPALMNGGLGAHGDLRLNNGAMVTQINYPEYELEQEMKTIKDNTPGTFGQIAGIVATAALTAAGTFVGGPALGAALAAATTAVKTKSAGAAAESGALSYAGSALFAAL